MDNSKDQSKRKTISAASFPDDDPYHGSCLLKLPNNNRQSVHGSEILSSQTESNVSDLSNDFNEAFTSKLQEALNAGQQNLERQTDWQDPSLCNGMNNTESETIFSFCDSEEKDNSDMAATRM